ncbi:MAG: Gfo/Idh/MocA family oxidoreductase [Candidatus Saccharibacteria bacterium]|nr:Gfo/Idh/MocA family oxidoreductase [Candidatus Saccharibacteria bacterium]
MQVLIVGYGKIGQIKANIWKSFGVEVLVYDISPQKHTAIQDDGHANYETRAQIRSSEDLILDISTPAGHHLNSLIWALAQEHNYTSILIEKPLASSAKELQQFKELLNASDVKLSEKIYINESYYCSIAILYVIEQLGNKLSRIQSLDIELSKNRLSDSDSGRFFDTNLEALGIEAPHMLAILQKLGIDISALHDQPGRLIRDVQRPDNQAYIYEGLCQGTKIRLVSYLGDFRLDKVTISKNIALVRKLVITTSDRTYLVEFDPVNGGERYASQVSIIEKGGRKKVHAFVDDHLRQHLSNFIPGATMEKVQRKLVSFNNALQITDELIQLRKSAVTVNLSDIESK